MVMEADLFVQTTTTSEATSTGNTTTESVVQLPRVSSSPVITSSSGGATASLTASASSVVLGSKEAELAATAAAAGGNNLILEDEDAFLLPTGGCSTSGGGGGGGGSSTRNRPMMSSNYYRQPSRRERRQRSLSSISSPNSHFAGASHGQQPQQPQQSSASAQQPPSQQPRSHHHQRSTSAILDLGFEPAASKRRSLSTAAASDGSSTDLQVGDKPKISKSVSDNLIVTSTSSGASVTSPSSSTSTLASEIEAGLMTSVSPSASAVFASSGEKVTGGNPWTDSPWTLESSSKLPVSKSRMVPSASTGGHVRFTETDKPYKCHHLLNSDETEPSQRWLASMPSTAASVNPGQTVQRANSNPEMELCSVCLARKECEILLKRTWSKVNLLIN